MMLCLKYYWFLFSGHGVVTWINVGTGMRQRVNGFAVTLHVAEGRPRRGQLSIDERIGKRAVVVL